MPLYYAQSAGIFRNDGLEVQFDPATGGSAVVAAVTSGAYDIGKASVISAFRAVSRGIPLVAVAPGWVFEASNSSAEMIVAMDSPVKSGAAGRGERRKSRVPHHGVLNISDSVAKNMEMPIAPPSAAAIGRKVPAAMSKAHTISVVPIIREATSKSSR